MHAFRQGLKNKHADLEQPPIQGLPPHITSMAIQNPDHVKCVFAKFDSQNANIITIGFNSYVNFLSRFQETMLHLRGFRRISLMLSQSATFQISQESFTSS